MMSGMACIIYDDDEILLFLFLSFFLSFFLKDTMPIFVCFAFYVLECTGLIFVVILFISLLIPKTLH